VIILEIVMNDTIFGAYVEAMNQVLRYGKTIKSNQKDRGDVCQLEVLMSEIRLPQNQKIKHPYWYGAKLDNYKKIERVDNDFKYTYIDRLRYNFCAIDQLDECIDILSTNDDSRRALGITWQPEIDLYENEVPCMILNQFKIVNGKLNINAVWRSHDIYGAYYPNLILLHEIQKYVADGVGVPTGKMYVMSMNPHIYCKDIIDAKKLTKSMPIGWW
jgi:thymidylate synthase